MIIHLNIIDPDFPIMLIIITIMLIAHHHLAIVGPRLPHHEVDLLLRQHLAQGGHRGRKVLKRTIVIILILIVLLILATIIS